MNTTEKAMFVAAGVALVCSVAAVGMTAIQALAIPSNSSVASVGMIVTTGIIGMAGLAAFGLLWVAQSTKRS